MIRNLIGIALMLVGPWVVWLTYAHAFRDFGGHREWNEAILCGFAVVIGAVGALMLDTPFTRWPLSARIGAFALYGTTLAIVMPWIAIFSVCTTGDCL